MGVNLAGRIVLGLFFVILLASLRSGSVATL